LTHARAGVIVAASVNGVSVSTAGSRWSLILVVCALLALSWQGPGWAQSPASPATGVTLGEGVLVAVPPGLVAVPVPELSGEVPGPQHAFIDDTTPPPRPFRGRPNP